jgi:pyrroloquinoline quinone biosynthesis protein B
MRRIKIHLFIFLAICCAAPALKGQASAHNILVLGVAQDGGYPHIGCKKECCELAWKYDSLKRFVVSLALVDSASKQWWLVEATPDITAQLHLFDSLTGHQYPFLPSGIFITHAHIGHYTGLMQLGKEAMNAKQIPVYTMPRMKEFLSTNGPWSQLVNLHNISLVSIVADSAIQLASGIRITPWLVPHRDEYSETVGFKIEVATMKYLFIPDIDKWSKWNRDIVHEVRNVNVAFLDGTFYSEKEIPGRNMAEIPHPTILETSQLQWDSDYLSREVHFIHFNHTNPMLSGAVMRSAKLPSNFNIAQQAHWY